MAKYSLTLSNGFTKEFSKVNDLHFTGHSCVYNVAKSNALLDRPIAWASLRLVYGFRPKAAPAERVFRLAETEFTLRRLA